MKIYLRMPNYNALYESLPNTILLNNVPYVTKEDRASFNDLIVTKVKSDILSSIPTCECGKYQHGYNSGRICDRCDTVVELQNEKGLDTRIWIKAPEGVKGFISPYLWIKLTRLAAFRGYSILQWALTTRAEPAGKPTKLANARIAYLNKCGWERSLNHFVDNWETFFQMLVDTVPAKVRYRLAKELDTLRKYKDKFFPTYLPIPSKALMIIEETHVGSYADVSTMCYAIAAAKTIGIISTVRNPPLKPLSLKVLQNKTVEVCDNLRLYATNTFQNNIAPKPGLLRRHIFSGRCDWTGRAVITSIPTPHHYGELHVPWAVGVELFKYHIYNVLRKRHGYTRKQETDLVEYAACNYHPLIDSILKELISDNMEIPRVLKDDIAFFRHRGLNDRQIAMVSLPKTGIPVLMQRNPTLGLGSMQLLWLTLFKTDLTDDTFSMSDLIASAFNMDHDGDEMNLTVPLMREFITASKTLDIRYAIHDSVNLGKLNGNIKLPDPTLETLGNFVNHRYHCPQLDMRNLNN